MKLNDLKKAAARTHQDLQLAERKAADFQRKANAAKAKTEQTRLEFKRARKSAKQLRKLASAAEDQACEQRRVLEKAQKRLAKALKKLRQGKGKQKNKLARRPAVARPSAPSKPVPPKQSAAAPKTQKPTDGRHSPLAAAGGASAPPIIPTV